MTDYAQLVILASKNGRDDWFPVEHSEVPEWVKDPDNMGRLVNGEACMKCDEGPTGSLWYRAATTEEMSDMERIIAAHKKLERRRQRTLH